MGWRALLLVLLFIASIPRTAAANGCFKSLIAHPAAPTIPLQRAMIVHRGGVETLIVESTYQTDSPSVGWILPLPAEPTKLEQADPAMLASLSKCLSPKIVADVRQARGTLRSLLLLVSLVAIVVVFSRKGSSAPMNVLVAATLVLLVISILLPSLGGGPPSALPVEVAHSQRVGNYDAKVLRATSSEALSRWLSDNGLQPLNELEQEIFDDYATRGWCFVVARLVRDASGAVATPHPIASSFPAARPVFPMRATSLAGSATLVELFVVSDGQASAEHFQQVVADRWEEPSTPHWAQAKAEVGPWMHAPGLGLNLGHPDAVSRMWDRCVLTRLSAQLTPAQMERDVQIQLSPFAASRQQRRFSPRARRDLSTTVIYGGGTLVVALAAIGFQHRRRPKRWEVAAMAIAAAFTLVAAGAIYALVPVMPVVETSRVRPIHDQSDFRYVVARAGSAVESGAIGPSDLNSPAEFAQALVRAGDATSGAEKNAFTHEPLKRERSAGNYDVRELDGRTVLCLYDRDACEIRLPLLPAASTKPSASK